MLCAAERVIGASGRFPESCSPDSLLANPFDAAGRRFSGREFVRRLPDERLRVSMMGSGLASIGSSIGSVGSDGVG
jgi:hypothetical protein